jgi:hypothetical protein
MAGAKKKTAKKRGRPAKWESPEALQVLIDEYFTACDENKRPYTVSGLAVALDTTRRTLCDYEKKDDFTHTIKRAKQRVEQYAAEALFTSRNTAGVIFTLKNNHDWVDRKEVANEHKHTGSVQILLPDNGTRYSN